MATPADRGADSQAVVDAMSAAVARRVPEWYGAGAVAGPASAGVKARPFSFFLRFPVVDAAGQTARVLVKVPRRSEKDSLAVAATEPCSPGAAREYETLVAIQEAVVGPGGAGLRAIRPLGFLEPWNAFAMEEVQGRDLKTLVTRWAVLRGVPGEWRRLERVYHDVGVWLARFHDRLGGAREEPVDKPRLRQLAAATLDALEGAAGRRLETASLRDAVRERIEVLASPWDRVADLHGDFKPAHILVTPDERIVVIDTHRGTSGSIYAEVARLATDLSTLKLQTLSHGLAYRAPAVQGCVEALLRGYFGDRAPDRQLLSVHCGLAVVRKWAEDEGRIAGARGIPRAARRVLAAWVGSFQRRQFLEWLAR